MLFFIYHNWNKTLQEKDEYYLDNISSFEVIHDYYHSLYILVR